MDRAGSRWGFVAGVNGPRARLLFAGSNERAKTEKMINSPNERVRAAIFHTEIPQIFQGFLLAKIDKFTLDLCADHDGFGAIVVLRIILNKIDMSRGRIRRIALGSCRQ